jgi:hypothetical protein
VSGDEELLEALGRALAPDPRAGPSAERVARLRADAAAAGSAGVRPAAAGAPRGPRMWRARAVPALRYASVAAVIGVLVGTAGGVLAARGDADRSVTAGSAAVEVSLLSPADRSVRGRATITRTGTGQTVRIDDDDLAAPPEDGFYEVWLIGPNDAPGRPERISAGTFHPDGQGHTSVQLAVGVDLAGFADLAITREPGDGDPAASDDVVRRARLHAS